MDFTLYWFMFPVSILVATCAMLSGIGGAAFFTPIFILVFPLLGPEYVLESTLAAIGAALFTQTFGFLSGFIGYYRRKLIDYRLAWRILRIAVPMAVFGAFTASMVHDSVLLAGYALLVGILAFVMWRNPIPGKKAEVKHKVIKQRELTDSRGHIYAYDDPQLAAGNDALTGVGAFLTGMVSVGIGEVTISQLTRKGIPIAVAAATSVLVVIVTVVFASTALFGQLIHAGGWTAVPWNLLCYDIPGVLIGGQIGPRLQGRVSQHTMRRSISLLFVILAVAMIAVASQRAGLH
ncbi:MAG: sulfite exporter TauE/SafE family protein [Gammaproteobacteria bacterium]|nr:sulfite exporter TauE/SafE family protein [Gammaproteobacteria bacterium]